MVKPIKQLPIVQRIMVVHTNSTEMYSLIKQLYQCIGVVVRVFALQSLHGITNVNPQGQRPNIPWNLD